MPVTQCRPPSASASISPAPSAPRRGTAVSTTWRNPSARLSQSDAEEGTTVRVGLAAGRLVTNSASNDGTLPVALAGGSSVGLALAEAGSVSHQRSPVTSPA